MPRSRSRPATPDTTATGTSGTKRRGISGGWNIHDKCIRQSKSRNLILLFVNYVT